MADSKSFLLAIDPDGKGFQTVCHLILDDRQRVWVAALKEKIFPLPGCQHTCVRPEKPGNREFLDLEGLGRILGVSLPPAFYSPVSTGVRSGFFHRQKKGPGPRSEGDWEATDAGTGLDKKRRRRSRQKKAMKARK
jgi:hypothetical protein